MLLKTSFPFNPIVSIRAVNRITSAYQTIGLTGTGTSGTNTITASATATALMFIGQTFRIGGTDTYVVSNLSGTTITTTTNLLTDYTAATIEAIRISQIDDSAGNVKHATNATASQQPTYVATSPMNNKPAYGFNSTDDFITIPGASNSSTEGLFRNGGTCLFTFYTRTIGETSGRIFDKGIFTASASTLTNGKFRLVFTATNGLAYTKNEILPQNGISILLITFLYNSTTYDVSPTIYHNSATALTADSFVGATSGNDDNNARPITLGNTTTTVRTYDGYFGDAIFWKRILTAGEIRACMNYFANYYGVTLT